MTIEPIMRTGSIFMSLSNCRLPGASLVAALGAASGVQGGAATRLNGAR